MARGQRLEWQGGILSENTAPVIPVGKEKAVKKEVVPEAWTGGLHWRKEVKGRSGHPVFVLYGFAPAANEGHLQWLCKTLKNKLACGGSVDGETVIIQIKEEKRLIETLKAIGVKIR